MFLIFIMETSRVIYFFFIVVIVIIVFLKDSKQVTCKPVQLISVVFVFKQFVFDEILLHGNE